jgi:branched-chain amino acid transport system permease protein
MTAVRDDRVGHLRAEAVAQHFGGLRALDGVSLTVRQGQIVGLIGPNGSGKTTLLNALSGVRRPTAGAIWIDHDEVTGLVPERMSATGVARTFQNIRLFAGLTVQENVETGLRHVASRDRFTAAQGLLAEHGMLELADRWAGTLAYAQQRRLELVRALATQPRFLLLDEPAAGMNRSESTELLTSIRALPPKYGLGVLIIDHDLHLITQLCERITVLNEGVVIAEGTPAEIQADEGVISAYLGRPDSGHPSTAKEESTP